MYRRFSLLIFGIVLIYTIESAGAQVFLTGKVTHNGPNAIPRNAKCEVSLQDVSRMDAPSIVIASVVIQATTFPVSYRLNYNPSDIKPGNSYAVYARITGADGQLIFSNDVRIRVEFSHLRTTYFEIPVTRSNTGVDFGVGTGVGKGLGVGGEKFITGTITSIGSNNIRENLQVKVELRDISLMDVASKLIGSTVFSATSFPIQYKLKYNPSDIQSHGRYSLSVEIKGSNGIVLYTNTFGTSVDFSTSTSPKVDISVTRSTRDVGTGVGKGLGVGGEKFITGTITSIGSNNVRENLKVTVELRDISLMDVASKLIGSTVFSATSFPILYKLKYNPSDIQSHGRYSLSVEIKGSNGIILYTNTFGTSVDFSTSTSPKVDISVTQSGRNINSNSVCDLPKAPGRCFGLFRRFFYNSLTGNCESFVYGGCGGNKNNFKSKNQCQLTCKT